MAREIGQNKVFFIDWSPVYAGWLRYEAGSGGFSSFAMPQGVRLVVERPEKSPAWLKSELPWEDRSIHAYFTVIHDGGRYRLWYEALGSYFEKESDDYGVRLCYAESDDGYHWTRPRLGVVSYRGSKDNNVVFDGYVGHKFGYAGGTVFIDPVAPAEERYKLIYTGSVSSIQKAMIRGATSPDGIHWNAFKEPLFDDYCSDTQTTAHYDPRLRCYVGYFRQWSEDGRRGIARATTKDFRIWPRPVMMLLLDGPQDHPCHDLYTNAHVLYQSAGPDEPADPENPSNEGAAILPFHTDVHLMFPAQYTREKDSLEVYLATSRDGIRWHYWADDPLVVPEQRGEGREGSFYAACGMVPMGKDKMAIAYVAYPATHNDARFEQVSDQAARLGAYHWAIWEKDRLVAIEAAGEGSFSTLELKLLGRRLMMNLRTEVAGEVRVQLHRAYKDDVIPGHTFADCDPIRGDQPCATVTWRGKPDLTDITGQPMQVELRMRAARLYTFWAE